jgi:hypothetical protein
VQINASKIYLNGQTIATSIDSVDAKITNLTSGTTTAATIKSNHLKASNSLSLGGYYHHNSTITIEGTNYNIVTWSSSM